MAVGWFSDSPVWTSADGINWAPALEPAASELVFGGYGIEWINGVAAGSEGVVAVGAFDFYTDSDGDAAVWRFGD